MPRHLARGRADHHGHTTRRLRATLHGGRPGDLSAAPPVTTRAAVHPDARRDAARVTRPPSQFLEEDAREPREQFRIAREREAQRPMAPTRPIAASVRRATPGRHASRPSRSSVARRTRNTPRGACTRSRPPWPSGRGASTGRSSASRVAPPTTDHAACRRPAGHRRTGIQDSSAKGAAGRVADFGGGEWRCPGRPPPLTFSGHVRSGGRWRRWFRTREAITRRELSLSAE